MRDPISSGLLILADGLRPYVTSHAVGACLAQEEIDGLADADVQGLMVFMWTHWHDLFRCELGHAERSLLSELREFRNRWAHQQEITERDTYRILDDIDRLLTAIGSPVAVAVTQLRGESLKRLYDQHKQGAPTSFRERAAWPLTVCVVSAVALDATLLTFSRHIASFVLSIVITVAIARIAFLLVRRVEVPPGPRECRRCGRVVYTPLCPYCESSHAVELMKPPAATRKATAVR